MVFFKNEDDLRERAGYAATLNNSGEPLVLHVHDSCVGKIVDRLLAEKNYWPIIETFFRGFTVNTPSGNVTYDAWENSEKILELLGSFDKRSELPHVLKSLGLVLDTLESYSQDEIQNSTETLLNLSYSLRDNRKIFTKFEGFIKSAYWDNDVKLGFFKWVNSFEGAYSEARKYLPGLISLAEFDFSLMECYDVMDSDVMNKIKKHYKNEEDFFEALNRVFSLVSEDTVSQFTLESQLFGDSKKSFLKRDSQSPEKHESYGGLYDIVVRFSANDFAREAALRILEATLQEGTAYYDDSQKAVDYIYRRSPDSLSRIRTRAKNLSVGFRYNFQENYRRNLLNLVTNNLSEEALEQYIQVATGYKHGDGAKSAGEILDTIGNVAFSSKNSELVERLGFVMNNRRGQMDILRPLMEMVNAGVDVLYHDLTYYDFAVGIFDGDEQKYDEYANRLMLSLVEPAINKPDGKNLTKKELIKALNNAAYNLKNLREAKIEYLLTAESLLATKLL